jgi:hypothetical protein
VAVSAIAESLRRQWIPVAGFGVVVIAAIVWLLTLHYGSPVGSTSNLPQAAPAVEQAPWKVTRTIEGRSGKLSNADKKDIQVQGDAAIGLVKTVIDGIFLEPANLDDVVKKSFSAEAARSLNARQLGFPDGTTDVKTTTRRVKLGIDSSQARFATADVSVTAKGDAGTKLLNVSQHATLWIERDGSQWHVIAFDVQQRPTK